MDKDRINGSAEQAKGAVKETAGRIIGDKKLETDGKTDEAAGHSSSSYETSGRQIGSSRKNDPPSGLTSPRPPFNAAKTNDRNFGRLSAFDPLTPLIANIRFGSDRYRIAA
jgi:uncharacterized protein YjbJ (UPF0337 family)